jgi:hypothetical protein
VNPAQHAPLSLWNVRRTLANAFKNDPTFRLPTKAEERSFRAADRLALEPTAEDAAEFHRQYDAAFEDAQRISWACQQTEGRTFTSERAVLEYLSGQWVIETGRPMDFSDTRRMQEAARIAWRGLTMATCAWCQRLYVTAHGHGIFCTQSCCDAEVSCA